MHEGVNFEPSPRFVLSQHHPRSGMIISRPRPPMSLIQCGLSGAHLVVWFFLGPFAVSHRPCKLQPDHLTVQVANSVSLAPGEMVWTSTQQVLLARWKKTMPVDQGQRREPDRLFFNKHIRLSCPNRPSGIHPEASGTGTPPKPTRSRQVFPTVGRPCTQRF